MQPLHIALDAAEVAKVDQHLEVTVHEVKPVDAHALKGVDIGAILKVLSVICSAYKVGKPVIDFAVKFLLKWKPSWQKAVTNITTAIEDGCALIP